MSFECRVERSTAQVLEKQLQFCSPAKGRISRSFTFHKSRRMQMIPRKPSRKRNESVFLFHSTSRTSERPTKSFNNIEKLGKIDTLVNNASKQTLEKDFTKFDLDVVESSFKSNILQMFGITKFALPYMAKGSSITNTTSVTTFKGSPSLIDYTGLHQISGSKLDSQRHRKCCRSNLVTWFLNIVIIFQRVNAVAPGPVYTPLQPASRPAEQMEGFGEYSKIGRLGQPSEIAPYVFLASAESELYYGQILHPYPLSDG